MSRQLISAILLLSLGTLSSVIVSDAAPESETVEIAAAQEGTALINQSPISTTEPGENTEAKKTVTVTVTAYSSEVAQTDSTPFITASNTRVRSGVVAANWLPIGTKVRIPEIYGNKIFTVEDRMHRRHTDRLDIWLPTKAEAIEFGVREAQIEIL